MAIRRKLSATGEGHRLVLAGSIPIHMVTLDFLKRFDGLVGIVHHENALQEADRKMFEVVGREGCLVAGPIIITIIFL